jgi:hypothetical protein
VKNQAVDLERVQTSLQSIEEALTRYPEIAERTRRYFAGELESDDMGRIPASSQPTSILMDDRMRELLDRLVVVAEAKFNGQLKRSQVMRMAMVRGLEALKKDWGLDEPELEKPSTPPRKLPVKEPKLVPKKKGGRK